LVRVIGLGSSLSLSGATVELMAVEIRSAGAIASLRFRPTEPVQAALLGDLEITVSDTLGTGYEVGALVWSRNGGGGEFAVVWTPRPPEAASELTLRIERFVTANPSDAPVEGPWTFTFALGD
jgi:hypothetical protein